MNVESEKDESTELAGTELAGTELAGTELAGTELAGTELAGTELDGVGWDGVAGTELAELTRFVAFVRLARDRLGSASRAQGAPGNGTPPLSLPIVAVAFGWSRRSGDDSVVVRFVPRRRFPPAWNFDSFLIEQDRTADDFPGPTVQDPDGLILISSDQFWSAQSDEFGTTKNADAHKITDDLNTNIRAKNASADIKYLLNNTATSPVPPVIERIEIRLVDSQNATDETPLIIVDVVKKNGSAGVAATIQQAIQTEKPALDEDVGSPKPDKSFLVRLRQPNYHSVSFVPFEAATTTTTSEQPNLEANNADENQLIESTELPFVGQMVHIIATEDEVSRQSADQNDDKMTPGQMKTIRNEEDKRTDHHEADDSDDDDEEMAEELGGRDEFVVNEAAILGETTNLSAFSAYGVHNNDDTLSSASSSFSSSAEEQPNISKLIMQHNSRSNDGDEQFGDDAALTDQQEEKPDQQEVALASDPEDEECLANQAKLSRETVQKLRTERRRIVQTIQRINKQQRELCQPDQRQEHVPYRKCPMWRREKFFLYYALMRLTYCANYERWPSAKVDN
uniref:Uncharacterized protein n=1 Tax=Globodera rostochiensis TaxID=31243 RepID=A0A914I4T5_GLORO